VLNARDEIYVSKGTAPAIHNNMLPNGFSTVDLIKMSPDGIVDVEFLNNLYYIGSTISTGHSLAIQCDGKILITASEGANNVINNGLIRLHANGIVDTPYNNTPANIASDLGLPESSLEVQGASTKSNYAPSIGKGLSIVPSTSSLGYNQVVRYDEAKMADFQEDGFKVDSIAKLQYVKSKAWGLADFDISDDVIIYSVQNHGVLAFSTQTGNLLWKSTDIDSTSINPYLGDISADGNLYAYFDAHTGSGNTRLDVRNTHTGALVYSHLLGGNAAPGVSFSPSGKYVYYIHGGGLYRYELSTDTVSTVTLPSTVLYGYPVIHKRVHFYNDTDFYVYTRNSYDSHIYKLKLDDPDSLNATLDTNYANNGDLRTTYANPVSQGRMLNGHTVGADGSFYILDQLDTDYTSPLYVDGQGITRIDTDGVIHKDYIPVATASLASIVLMDYGTIGGSTCGNGILETSEGCDDSNSVDGDGCSATCKVETGHTCNIDPDGALYGTGCESGLCDNGTCVDNICGNGSLEATEGCDDGNTDNGDGCNDVCLIESGSCNTNTDGNVGNASCASNDCDASTGMCVLNCPYGKTGGLNYASSSTGATTWGGVANGATGAPNGTVLNVYSTGSSYEVVTQYDEAFTAGTTIIITAKHYSSTFPDDIVIAFSEDGVTYTLNSLPVVPFASELHATPNSTLHVAEQPSSSTVLPSSHPSPISKFPSPHTN